MRSTFGNPDVLTADVATSRLARSPTSGTAIGDTARVDPATAPEPWPFVPPETADPAAASARRRPAPLAIPVFAKEGAQAGVACNNEVAERLDAGLPVVLWLNVEVRDPSSSGMSRTVSTKSS
ncbi:hypothetical protein [Streptomyces acidiscabies]|uniref:hypothetical protein n=1 Tax=Streptomyces acidiscabies TaxID=42234 RepID=UPI000AAB8DF2|nr:hypothetical protein [Streptomyces acidiscabies]